MRERRLVLAAGWVTLGLAIFHVFFWWVFDWSTGLAPLSNQNRGILLALHVHGTLVLFGFAAVSLWRPGDLLGLPLGRGMGWFIAAYWALRAIDEFILFSEPSVLLALVCAGVAAVYVLALLRTRSGAPRSAPLVTPGPMRKASSRRG